MALVVRNYVASITASGNVTFVPASGVVYRTKFVGLAAANPSGTVNFTDGTTTVQMLQTTLQSNGEYTKQTWHNVPISNGWYPKWIDTSGAANTAAGQFIRVDDQGFTGAGGAVASLAASATLTVTVTSGQTWEIQWWVQHASASAGWTYKWNTYWAYGGSPQQNTAYEYCLASAVTTNAYTVTAVNSDAAAHNYGYGYLRLDNAISLTITVAVYTSDTTITPAAGTNIALLAWSRSQQTGTAGANPSVQIYDSSSAFYTDNVISYGGNNSQPTGVGAHKKTLVFSNTNIFHAGAVAGMAAYMTF